MSRFTEPGPPFPPGWIITRPSDETDAMPGFTTKDSGERESWETGSRRDSREGKGRYDLLPPLAMRRLAQLYERGAAKYEARNWEKGQPLSRYLDSGMRHLFNVLEGESTEDHAAAVVWNLLAYIETEERIARGILPIHLDDRPAPLTTTYVLIGGDLA